MTRFWRPVSASSSVASWPVTPILRRTAGASLTTSWPATQARPLSGAVRVVRMRTPVVLPAPLGPRTPRIDPAGTSRSTLSSAWVSP